jgi:hypothetical protein
MDMAQYLVILAFVKADMKRPALRVQPSRDGLLLNDGPGHVITQDYETDLGQMRNTRRGCKIFWDTDAWAVETSEAVTRSAVLHELLGVIDNTVMPAIEVVSI